VQLLAFELNLREGETFTELSVADDVATAAISGFAAIWRRDVQLVGSHRSVGQPVAWQLRPPRGRTSW